MTRSRRTLVAAASTVLGALLGSVLAVTLLGAAPPAGGGEPGGAAARRAGSLHLSEEVAEAHARIKARGRVVPRVQRRVVLQRSVGDGWRRVSRGYSGRRGRYVLTTRLPAVRGSVVRYRVLLPRWRVRGTVLSRRVTRSDSVRVRRSSETTSPAPDPAAGPTATPSPPPAPSVGPSTGPTPPLPAFGETVVAEWRMDEPPGATVMTDSSGHGHHGAISPDAAAAGLVLDGAVYTWSVRCRDCPPVALPRVVQVPDSADLDIRDPGLRWALELRFRTTESHGNIMQKGQATAPGGQIKVEDASGLRCVFKGADGRSAVAAGTTPLDDGAWHTAVCVHTATAVSQWVDGVLVARTVAATGRIDNDDPFVVGGKRSCNQRTVGCDYYSGSVDWARVSHG